MIRFKRVLFLIIKEFQVIFADKNNRAMILFSPIMLLTLFAFTATLEVKNISLAIYDKDNSSLSRHLSGKFKNTNVIKNVYYVGNRKDMTDLINREKVYVVITIPQNFEKNLYSGNINNVQIILDGRKSNASQIVASYAANIIQKFTGEINDSLRNMPKIEVRSRNLFNPNLNYQWFVLISLTGVLSINIALTITALAVAQEKELGTFEQIIVSPLSSSEILIGKTIPAVLITLFDTTVMVLASVLFFKVPMEGSILVLYICIILFLLCIAGIGLTISTICKTQQQAVLGVFVFFAPVFLISGYVTPIDNMPIFLQKLAIINPLTYFFTLMKGIFLKNITTITIIKNCLPLSIIAFFTLTFSLWFFNKNLE